jgi:hypothetical protein
MTLSSSDKGGLLAAANVVTVALCGTLMVLTGHDIGWPYAVPLRADVTILFALLVIMPMLPALLAGAFVGSLASRVHRSPRVRFLVLASVALCFVTAFGILTMWFQLIPLAAIPTLIWTARLERWTRAGHNLPAAYQLHVRS